MLMLAVFAATSTCLNLLISLKGSLLLLPYLLLLLQPSLLHSNNFTRQC
jgi:hypothetical protein